MKKTGKNAPIVVQNAWAALQAATSSEDDDEKDSEDEEQEVQQEPERSSGNPVFNSREEHAREPEAEPEPQQEQGQPAPSVVHLGRSDDPKVQQLMDLGANCEEASTLLEQTGGDVDAAADIYFGSWEQRLASLGTWATG